MSRCLDWVAMVVVAPAIGSAGAGRLDAADAIPPHRAAGQPVQTVKIRIVAEGAVLTATLDDHPTARALLALLPLQLTLEDYAATEKISDLPKRLPTEGSPPGTEPAAGDLAYYAPWGNLAVFHRPFRYSPGLVRLGRIDGDIGVLRRRGALRVRIERVED